jgi:hypothetical protein
MFVVPEDVCNSAFRRLTQTIETDRLKAELQTSSSPLLLPFAGEQIFMAPVPFNELSVLVTGVTPAIVEFEAHLTLLIDQLQTRLRSVAYVAVAEFERRDSVGAAMYMIVAASPLDYGFKAIVTQLKFADDVRRHPACSCRCDEFS